MSDASTAAAPARLRTVEVHEVDDGYVIYDESHQRVHYLNASAALVYEFVDGKRDEAALARLLAAAFGQDQPAVGEVAEALEQLRREQLVG